MRRCPRDRFGACLAGALLAWGCSSPDPGPAPFNDTIEAAQLSADLHFLAGDGLAGRLVGTPGISLAADFIASRFERMGLEPAGDDDTYYQNFDLVRFTLGPVNRLSIRGAGFPGAAEPPGPDWHPLNFSATARASGPLVFAGFGIREPGLSYDDYAGQDVSGKIVLVLDREPGVSDPASPFDGVVTAEASAGWRKALAAQESGAAGILFVTDVHNRPDDGDFALATRSYWPAELRRIERFSLAAWMERIRIPAARIRAAQAERLVAGSGRTLQELAASSETASGLGPVDLPGPVVTLEVAVERHVVPARNVLALLEGSDPALRDEVILITAHHDHNGADETGVFNGADDDGSGTVGLLEIAEAWASASRAGQGPRRSVLFAAWDAEERGLLGAWYHTERPRFPLEQTVAVLNMDMIGRNEEVPVDGGGRFRGLEVQTAASNANAINILGHTFSTGMQEAVTTANAGYGLELKFRYDNNESNLLRRSDHWPFLQRGVPALWFHTGLHPDYHTTDDVAGRIEYGKMERIVRLVHQLSWDLSQSDGRPGFARRRQAGPG